jgi:hypothetical protein
MRIPALLMLYSLLVVSAYSQDTIILHQKPRDLLFKGGHFGFSIIPLINQKADADRISGPYRLKTKPAGGIEAGFNYDYNFNNRYSLIIGIHGGVNVRNFSLFVPKEDFIPNKAEDFIADSRSSRVADMYLSAPVLFEYRWKVEKRNFWNVQAGVNIRYYPDEIYESSGWYEADNSGGYYKIIDLELLVSRNLKPWIDYNLGAGYTITLRNWNFFRANLLFNMSGKSIASGMYTIRVQGQPDSFGNYASKHSFLGLSLSYTWTGTNSRVLKPIRKSLRNR